VILPKDRDPRFITIRRGGTLTDSDHRLLALWAAACAEHVLHRFESVQPTDLRPRHAIDQARAWVRGEITMSQARAAGGHAMAAARALRGTPDMLPARRPWWRMSPHTSLVLRPTPSRPRVRLPLKVRRRALAGSSASGSANSCRRRFASWFWTTSGSETTSAGRCSTADRPSAHAGTAQQALRPDRFAPSEIVAILAPGFGSTAFPIYRCGAAEAQGVSQTRGEA
jgi:hypothetical protein